VNDGPVRRVVTIQIGWVALAGILVLVALLALAVRRPVTPPPIGVDPAAVRAACEQYASLDLSGWARICADARRGGWSGAP
jgi:hypothetical protein